jgi:hypothetical protein
MSMTGQGGPLPVLEVSGHGHSNRLGHRLAAFRPCEHLLGQPVPFEELVSVGDAFEGVAGVDRLKFEGAAPPSSATGAWRRCRTTSTRYAVPERPTW